MADRDWEDMAAPSEDRAAALLAALSTEERIAVAMGHFDTVAHPRAGRTAPVPVLASGIVTLQIDEAVVAAGQREFGQEFGGPALPVSGAADLRAGQPVSLQFDYNSATAWVMPDLGLGGDIRLGWQHPDSQIRDAAQLAAGCDVAIVFASQAQGEGMDRASLALPR